MPRPLDDGFTQDWDTPHLDLMDAKKEIEELQVELDSIKIKYRRLKSLVEEYFVCDLTVARNGIDRAVEKLKDRIRFEGL